jgi:cytochrome P450
MSNVSAPVAMRFASSIVGVSGVTSGAYFPIFLRLTRGMDSALDPALYDAGVEAGRELNALVDDALASATPGTIIHTLRSDAGVAEMHPGYVRNTISATFNAAYSTAYSSMGSFLLLALSQPALAARIVNTGDVCAGVQELLRIVSPAQSTRRFATDDTVVGGVTVGAHDPILVLIASANRDEDAFPNPDELLPDRRSNAQLSFGSGPHHCVGVSPARQFLEEFVGRLARWERRLAAAGPPTWLTTFTLRCLDRLPVARTEDVVVDCASAR